MKSKPKKTFSSEKPSIDYKVTFTINVELHLVSIFDSYKLFPDSSP